MLRYVYAILAIVVIAVTTVLSALFFSQQDENKKHERVEFYHLESVSASGEVRREVAALKTLVQLAIVPGMSVPAGPAGVPMMKVGPSGILQSVSSRVHRMSALQQQYGGTVFGAIIERMLARLDRIEGQLHQPGGPSVETLQSLDVLAATIEQYDRLHKIEAKRELQAISQIEREKPRFFAILLACLAFSALVVGYLIRSLMSSLTRQHHAEVALADSQERLHHIQKLDALGRLVGGVAHDFNNLLTVILGHVDMLLLPKPKDSGVEDSLGEIRKAGKQAASLTQQLLAFSRRQQLQPKALELNEQIAGLEPLLKRIVSEDVKLRFSYVDDPCAIEADPDQLRQVIMNLIGNACDAMPDGGELKISTDNVEVGGAGVQLDDLPDGRYAMLAVADSGMGMDEEMVQRIFEPFFTTKEESRGTGLGLSTVHGVVTGSGGHIHVDSNVGKGTVFSIYFPRTDKSAQEEQEANDDVAPQHGSETILIVEDEESVLQFVQMGLSSLGYSVMTAASGADGLDICKRQPGAIDVILSDVVMPEMSGPMFMEQALLLCEGAVPIFMSAYTRDEASRFGNIGNGDIPLLNKPFTLDELAHVIREQLSAQTAA